MAEPGIAADCATTAAESQALKPTSSQFLTFILNGEEYGIEILGVQEIKGWERGTALPGAPDYVLGVINMRGSIVPVIDLRRRFGLAPRETTKLTVVIVVLLKRDDGDTPMGLVVDAVSDVYSIESASIQPPPEVGCSLDLDFVKGLATVDEKMIILLDVNQIVKPRLTIQEG